MKLFQVDPAPKRCLKKLEKPGSFDFSFTMVIDVPRKTLVNCTSNQRKPCIMIRVPMKIKNPATRIRNPSDRERPVIVSEK
jgi:hypothetical protein